MPNYRCNLRSFTFANIPFPQGQQHSLRSLRDHSVNLFPFTYFLYLSAWQNWICPVCSAREQKVCIPIRTVGSPGTGQARGPSHLKDTPFNNLSGAQLCWAQWLKWSRKLRKCRKQRTVWKTQLLPGGSQPISGIFLFFPSKNIHVTSSFISYDRGKKKKKERRLPSVVLDTWKTYVSPGQYTKK